MKGILYPDTVFKTHESCVNSFQLGKKACTLQAEKFSGKEMGGNKGIESAVSTSIASLGGFVSPFCLSGALNWLLNHCLPLGKTIAVSCW